jgi:hypothetical protein
MKRTIYITLLAAMPTLFCKRVAFTPRPDGSSPSSRTFQPFEGNYIESNGYSDGKTASRKLAGQSVVNSFLVDIFPASTYSPSLGSSTFTTATSWYDNGSVWSPNLTSTEEESIFLREIVHGNDGTYNHTMRVGMGGQLYSLRFGGIEAIGPQNYNGQGPWNDQVVQSIVINTDSNNTAQESTYFYSHQAGDYINRNADAPTTPFSSPLLASLLQTGARAFSTLNWGQMAHVPNAFKGNAMHYAQYKQLGEGIIEMNQAIYNFGDPKFNYFNMPWACFRYSQLSNILIGKGAGGYYVSNLSFGTAPTGNINNIDTTGGWIIFSNTTDSSATGNAVGLVYGYQSSEISGSGYRYNTTRLRYGKGPVNDTANVVVLNPRINLDKGKGLYWRTYIVTGRMVDVMQKCKALVAYTTNGFFNFPQSTADIKAIYLKSRNGQTICSTSGDEGQDPSFYTFAQPVENSLPLFVVQETSTNKQKLTTDPYEYCPTTSGGLWKPYDPSWTYVHFLGYALPDASGSDFMALKDSVTDVTYFPATTFNQTIKVIKP